MTGDQSTDQEYAARMIRQNKTLDELAGYEMWAKLRGISAHELRMIEAHRNALTRRK